MFVLGFVFLIKGASLLVDGASATAKRLGVMPIIIGLTVVAFGTSAPELAVNILAAINGSTDIAIGNIVGSNIVNILFILGAAAVVFPLAIQKSVTWRDIPLALLAAVLVFVMANDALISGASRNMISRTDGIILLAFFGFFLYYTFSMAKRHPDISHVSDSLGKWRAVLYMIIGLVGLIFGGKWIVDGATAIATAFGVSQSIIGLTIVAIGTSLPELATSLVAAFKKQPDIAVGNIVGSNIFNIFFVLGLTAVISPLPFNITANFDMAIMLGASTLLFVFLFIGRKGVIDRWQGMLFILFYLLYIASFVLRH